MSIFDKLRELFYGRPKKLASNSTRAERGQYGEDLAADYCKRTLGFQVIARNWRHKRDELDIVCLDAGVLVFVEVRARAADALVVLVAGVRLRPQETKPSRSGRSGSQ